MNSALGYKAFIWENQDSTCNIPIDKWMTEAEIKDDNIAEAACKSFMEVTLE